MSYFNYHKGLKKHLKHTFQNVDKLETNYSQLQQDLFVLSILDGKQNGIFVDIGAHHPIAVNNTYLLETVFNWTGISIELDSQLAQLFNQTRNTPCICADATRLDYIDLLMNFNIPNQIDYLTVDIEPPDNTFLCLKSIIEIGLRPTVITFEHEAMSGQIGRQARIESREFLQQYGYTLIVKDVSNLGIGPSDLGVPYNVEDWWVLKEKINSSIFEKLLADKVEYIESRNTVYNL